MKHIAIKSVRFKRLALSPYELGVMFGDDRLIIDSNYKPVEAPVWTWHPTGHFTIDVEIALIG